MKRSWFYLLLSLLSGLAILFVVLPLGSLYLGQSWESLAECARDVSILGAFLNSFVLAVAAAVIAVVVGTPLGYLLARDRIPAPNICQAIADLPLAVPHSVAGIALLMFLGRDAVAGALVSSLFGLSFVGTRAGIVAAMLFVSLPYAVSSAREAFERVSIRTEQVAASLGAPPASVFFRVSLPLAKGGITSGAILTWARSISEFGAVVILAYYPMTAPVKIWDEFASGTLEHSAAIAALFLLLCLGAFVIMRAIAGRHADV